MRRTLSLVTAAALFGVAGCGGKTDGMTKVTLGNTPAPPPEIPDGLMKDILSAVQAVCEAMEKTEPKETIEALVKTAEAAIRKLQDYPLSMEDRNSLGDKYKVEIERTMERYSRAGSQYTAATGHPAPRISGMRPPPTPKK